jgi:lipopolysaccharide transport system permease protein/teichoic acid transport system permease protein
MKQFKGIFRFLASMINQRYLIQQLVRRDFQNKYLASYIGLPWAFMQPAVLVLVMWFAFSYGLKISVMESGIPFVPWLICGMLPWLFISDTLTSSSGSLIEYSYLIKKTSFKVGIIPLIKIFTAFIIHLVFVVVIALIAVLYGYYPSIHWIQIFYYLFAVFVLLTGVGWLVSSLTVFVRDIGHMINVVTSVLFWATPIIWPYSMLQGNFKYMALLNPIFYITEGYRYTFLEQTWFFEYQEMTIFFWAFTALLFVAGALVFQRLKPHFADVL